MYVKTKIVAHIYIKTTKSVHKNKTYIFAAFINNWQI